MAIIVIFWSIFWDRMANLGLIDFKTGWYMKVNEILGKTNMKSISTNLPKMAINEHYLAITWSFSLQSRFLLRGLTWAVLNVWTQKYPQNVGTCLGLPHQPPARNSFFQSDRPEPPPPPPPPPKAYLIWSCRPTLNLGQLVFNLCVTFIKCDANKCSRRVPIAF